MKEVLLTLLGLLIVSTSQAAITSCKYMEEPCNDAGDHYQCYVYAWTDQQYCSATDRSTRVHKSFSEDKSMEKEVVCLFKPEVCGLNRYYCYEKDQPQNYFCQRM